MSEDVKWRSHSSHWGAFSARVVNDRIEITPHPEDPAPSPLLDNLAASARHSSRITKPMVRKGWLENGPGPDSRRGKDEFVPIEWPVVLDLLSDELKRIVSQHSPASIFGGSYGWSSAGRFHHAQSQVHRFLNTSVGGYVRSVNTYSNGTASVLLPHVLGSLDEVTRNNSALSDLRDHAELVVAFGGLPIRNGMVSGGGNSRHLLPDAIATARARGTQFVLVSPIRDDLPLEIESQWMPAKPATDTALMLGLAHTLVEQRLHDRVFLDRYCTGYDAFEDYLCGRTDGQPKSAAWAAEITGIAEDDIRKLASRMAVSRTMITVSYSLQRAKHGEQPVWMGLTLAAMLGQIGLEGGGFYFGLGSIGNVGKPPLAVPLPTLPQGTNSVADYIPVARLADMLLGPGEAYQYNGKTLTYPDIRMVYWAGGNPFHHHQDLQRLEEAFSRPDTIVVHEPFRTATTQYADIVLPATITMERNDIGASANDPNIIAMKKIIDPIGEARDDFAIFSELAQRLGTADAFTEGRSVDEWLRFMYSRTRDALDAKELPAPDFDTFWNDGELTLPLSQEPGLLSAFRADPQAHRLKTPSGLVEISSAIIAGFDYGDCPGHPSWIAPDEWLGGARASMFPLQLIANQPPGRLHSQLDFGDNSQKTKVSGRERLRIHPADAAERGIADGATVRVFNDRGACLAGVVFSTGQRPGTVQLPTGAWYDPQDLRAVGRTCINGNPNVLTPDIGSSRLSQGCSGQLVLVEVENISAELVASFADKAEREQGRSNLGDIIKQEDAGTVNVSG